MENFDYELELLKAQERARAASLIMNMLLKKYYKGFKGEKAMSALEVCRKLVRDTSRGLNRICDDFEKGVEEQSKLMNGED